MSRVIGITFSTFDLLHAGHIAMLREAKSQCDYLIACLQSDPTIDRSEKSKPIQIPTINHANFSYIISLYLIDLANL